MTNRFSHFVTRSITKQRARRKMYKVIMLTTEERKRGIERRPRILVSTSLPLRVSYTRSKPPPLRFRNILSVFIVFIVWWIVSVYAVLPSLSLYSFSLPNPQNLRRQWVDNLLPLSSLQKHTKYSKQNQKSPPNNTVFNSVINLFVQPVQRPVL